MLGTSFMYPTAIRDIEITTLITCPLYEFPCGRVEYIVYSTTEAIASLTHSITRESHKKSNKEIKIPLQEGDM